MARTKTISSFLVECPEHLVAINAATAMNMKERLYVFSHTSGVSCLGFDNCLDGANRLAEWLKMEKMPANAGDDKTYYTLLHQRMDDLMKLARLRCEQEKTKCPCDLTPQLIGL
jgi:hypothetical protein